MPVTLIWAERLQEGQGDGGQEPVLRTGAVGTVSAVVVSALILTASTLFPLADEPEQSASFRFTPAEAGGVAARESNDHLLRLAHRWSQDEAYR